MWSIFKFDLNLEFESPDESIQRCQSTSVCCVAFWPDRTTSIIDTIRNTYTMLLVNRFTTVIATWHHLATWLDLLTSTICSDFYFLSSVSEGILLYFGRSDTRLPRARNVVVCESFSKSCVVLCPCIPPPPCFLLPMGESVEDRVRLNWGREPWRDPHISFPVRFLTRLVSPTPVCLSLSPFRCRRSSAPPEARTRLHRRTVGACRCKLAAAKFPSSLSILLSLIYSLYFFSRMTRCISLLFFFFKWNMTAFVNRKSIR